MKIELVTRSDDGETAVLHSRKALQTNGVRGPLILRYRTRTGALLRVGGVVRGAFDREHETIGLPADARGDITLAVERRALPVRGLPAGDGWRWRRLLARAEQTPRTSLEASPERARRPSRRVRASLAIVGHSHLDVAWLWTYDEAARKAVRTFATVVRQLERDRQFVFTQSQPQLYDWVAEREPELFERVRALVGAGRFDVSGAALWVEPDCNLPSGESLLRQLAYGIRYVEREFGRTPSVAWLPDSFGFPNTLPTLLAHAGVTGFGTTKLGWNDTTRFPYARFRWEGPDGGSVVAAQIASIAGDFAAGRVTRARRRGDVLLVGHGDGGGGVRDATLAAASAYGRWTTLAAWFATLAGDTTLPVVRDELYLEEHRGTATTHHEIKARNAALERALGDAELLLAWAKALHATPFFLDEARRQLAVAWEIVLRAQFHDVLPGTAIAPVYADVHREYDDAEALVAGVSANARTVLPKATTIVPPSRVTPRETRDGFVFENDRVAARVTRDGRLVDLRVPGGPNLVRDAHRLAAYVDVPKRWDAWNVDRSYRDRRVRMRATSSEAVEHALEIRYAIGASLAVASFSLDANEPFLRVAHAVAWRERHRLLRIENALDFAASRARFGTPHGAVDRAPAPRTRAERAKFEACGQRYARFDGRARGLALLALDTYGWSVGFAGGASLFGHSLLRSPAWPDPGADTGEHAFSFAYAPLGTLGMGELESMWERFAGRTEVPMFTSDDPALVVVATKLADDGGGVVVRARECDGGARDVALRCGARARKAICIDALERPASGTVDLRDGALHASFAPYQLRSFRVELA